MATTTTNYGLRKPGSNDPVNVQTDLNENFDKIDGHAHSGTYALISEPVALLKETAGLSAATLSALSLGLNLASFTPPALSGLDMWFDASNIGAGVVASDLFNRGNSATALGTADSGQAWTAHTGTFGISSNKAYMVSGTAGIASVLTNMADCTLTADITLAASGTARVRLYPRFQDSTNHIYIDIEKDSGANDFIQILKNVAGTPTSIAFQGSIGFALGSSYRIKVVCKGSTISVYLNDVLKVTGTDAAFNNTTRQGIGFASSDTLSRVDNFTVSGVTYVDTDTVAFWPELSSGLGSAYQATVASRPIYRTGVLNGLPVVRFDGAASTLTTAVPADGAAFTLLAVITRGTGGTVDTVVDSTSNGGAQLRVNADGTMELLKLNVASIGASADTIPASTSTIVAVTYDAAGTYVHYVGGRPSAPSLNLQAFTASTVVRIGGAGSEFFNGDIAELVRYNRVLYGYELKQAIFGLSNKWGIALKPRLGTSVRVPFRPTNRLKGSNIHPKASDFAYGSGSGWVGVWGHWDWTGWIKNSIDKAVSQGANVIRLVGDVETVFTGVISQATYLAQLEQMVAYLGSIGVSYYHCASDLRHIGNADPAYIKAFLTAQATQLAGHTNVAAFEICNEVASSFTTTTFPEPLVVSWVADWSKAIRTALPGVPLTVSNAGVQSGFAGYTAMVADYARLAEFDPYVDFFDMHQYQAAPTNQDLTPYFVMSDKPLMIGEMGTSRASGTPTSRAAYYEAIRQLEINNPGVVGVIQWAAINDNFGLYDETNQALQSDIAPTWANFSTPALTGLNRVGVNAAVRGSGGGY